MFLMVWVAAVTGSAAELSPKQVSVLTSIAQERFAPRWEMLGTNELGEMRLKVERYEAELKKSHLVGGLVVSLRYADTNRTQVVAYEALEDSTAWTGFYLAGLAMRFVVERRPATLESVRQVLDGVERLIQASGRPGYLPRFAGPARDEAFKAFYSQYGGPDPKRPGFGRWAFPGTNGLVWLAGPSREAYSGLNLGLALTHQFIREPGIRMRVSNIVDRLLTRIELDGRRLDDGVTPPEFLPAELHAALLRTGSSAVGRNWAIIYEKVAELVTTEHMADDVGASLPRYGPIRPVIFATADAFAMNRLETNRARKMMYQEKLSKIWRSSAPELNPWIAGAVISVDDFRQLESKAAPVDSTAMTILQGVLFEYPNWPRWAVSQPMPADYRVQPVEANGQTWSKHALPVYSRPVQAFQWAQPGRELVTNSVAMPVVHSGVDLLLPYWLARNAGVILPEDLPPLKKAAPTRTLGPRVGATNAYGRSIGTNAPAGSPKTNSAPNEKR